ncbi:MAG TPA: hypothetical protein DHW71_10955 [Gammaproteobacteria bacterium]|nr:hypothetical protein [Gammaproteobacteria bacterium]HBF10076.1 hypothetical protein [Gammaproteobacteria bacterium]HCK93501.1 hypothetical protein [Gammaproteobacteria bacterium]
MAHHSLKSYMKDLARQYKVYFSLLIVIALVAGFFSVAVEYKIKEIIDSIASEYATNLGWLLFLFVLYKFLYHGMYFINRLLAIRYMPRILESSVLDIYRQTVKHSLHWFDSNLAGEISNKIFDFQNGITTLVNSSFRLLNVVASIIFALLFLAYVNSSTALVILGFIAVYTPVIAILLKKQLKYYQNTTTARQQVVGVVNDSVSNIFGVKVIGNLSAEKNRTVKPAIQKWRLWDRKTRQFDAFFVDNIDTLLVTAMTAIQIYLLAKLLQSGEITAGGFAFVTMVTLKIHTQLEGFLDTLLFSINPSIAQIRSSYSFIYTAVDVEDKPNAKTISESKGEISYSNVNFGYGQGVEPILKDFNLNIKPGERLGIVGTSGAGKTTLVKCLLRYFDVQSGTIKLDGQNIDEITQESLRQMLSVIPQDITMFHRSVMDNLKLAKPEAADEEIFEACRKARIHDDILRMPEGYNTVVGERGVKLSGGQRQRVAIARAILKDAPVLVLDEATSSLDTTTEHLIQESINDMLESSKATVIAIAHRLSTLKHMDRIIVMNRGQITESGTHDKLIAQGGIYKQLWDMQLI